MRKLSPILHCARWEFKEKCCLISLKWYVLLFPLGTWWGQTGEFFHRRHLQGGSAGGCPGTPSGFAQVQHHLFGLISSVCLVQGAEHAYELWGPSAQSLRYVYWESGDGPDGVYCSFSPWSSMFDCSMGRVRT